MSTEASLERKASATLRTLEGLFRARPVDGLVGFELQQLGEGFPAVFAAQSLLLLTLLLCLSLVGLSLYNTLGSGGVSWVNVIWIVWFCLVVRVVLILPELISVLTRVRRHPVG